MTKAEKTLDAELCDVELDLIKKSFIGNKNIMDAMEEHSKAFAEWCGGNDWEFRNGSWSLFDGDYDEIAIRSTEELYQLFNNQ